MYIAQKKKEMLNDEMIQKFLQLTKKWTQLRGRKLKEKLKKLKEGTAEELKREVIFNISKWLVKEMEIIHKDYFSIKNKIRVDYQF